MTAASHTNIVTIQGPDVEGSQITGLNYVLNTFSITAGQPWVDGPIALFDSDHNLWTIKVDCGRQGSSAVADTFNAAAGSTYNEIAKLTEAKAPGELNFCFEINIAFSLVPGYTKVYLGQGSTDGLVNNWWIGGPAVLNSWPGASANAFLMPDAGHIYWLSFPHDNAILLAPFTQ